MKSTHILLTAGISLALTFTLSCSSDDPDDPDKGGDNISGPIVVEFAYTKTDESIAWTEPRIETKYSCEDGGTIQEYTRDDSRVITSGYTISNNSLSLNVDFRDTINFSGTSSNIVGTWTRAKGQCEIDERYPSEKNCKRGYDFTKAEFTDSKVKFTRDVCQTDYMVNNSVREDRKTTIIDCNTLEYSKGTEKARTKWIANGTEYTYNGKTCIKYDMDGNHYTAAQRAAACKKAWDEREGKGEWEWADDYSKFLRSEYYDCIKDFPSWL